MNEEQKKLAIEIRLAIRDGNTARAIELIGTDKTRLEIVTFFGSWLHVAARAGRLEMVKWLVESGIDIERRVEVTDGTALNQAAARGHLDVLEYLLARGAKMDVSDPTTNPLFGAIYGGHVAVAKALIQNGIDTTVKYTGETMKNMDALAFAEEWGRKEIAELLPPKTLPKKSRSARKPAS